jgi:hypothetical protein
MPEVLVVFDAQLTATDGLRWTAQACGGVADDGLWEGWIEFLPLDADESPVRTARETEQPNRDDLMYWAQGLTVVYLDGALIRALASDAKMMRGTVQARTTFEGPARPAHARTGRAPTHAVLDPFDVYQEGEEVLIAQLGALDTARLRDLAVEYGFSSRSAIAGASRERLTSRILAAVQSGRSQPSREPREFGTGSE